MIKAIVISLIGRLRGEQRERRFDGTAKGRLVEMRERKERSDSGVYSRRNFMTHLHSYGSPLWKERGSRGKAKSHWVHFNSDYSTEGVVQAGDVRQQFAEVVGKQTARSAEFDQILQPGFSRLGK